MKNKTILIFLFIAGFISVQRYLLASSYQYISLVVFVVAIMSLLKNKPHFLTILLFSIITSVDVGGEVYSITNTFIRYPIYITSILLLIGRSIKRKKFYTLVFFLILPFLNTFLFDYSTHVNTLIRDILIVILAFIVFTDYKKKQTINYHFLAVGMLGYLIGEIFNIVFFASGSLLEYLNYDSTKSFIVFPFIYFYLKEKKVLSIVVFILTITVLIFYATRMLMLSFIFITIFLFISSNSFKIKKLIINSLFIIIPILLISQFNFNIESRKATGVVTQFSGKDSFLDKLEQIDRVRFVEHKLFFQRSIFEVAFGSGFGSGLEDTNNELGFSIDKGGAFSSQEIYSGKYYNLHDTWIDFGLRFGLLAVLACYFFIFKKLKDKKVDSKISSAILFILFTCASFSSSGLILIAYFFKVLINDNLEFPKNAKKA